MINAKLQNIIDTKSAIGNAIVNKGGTITSSTPFYNYAAEIDNLSSGSTIDGYDESKMFFIANSVDNGFVGSPIVSKMNNSFIYWGGGNGGGNGLGIQKYYESNLVKVGNSANYGGTIRALTINNGFIYIAGNNASNVSNSRYSKFYESNLVRVHNSSNVYGGAINAIAVNNGAVFIGGANNSTGVSVIKKYNESDGFFDRESLDTNLAILTLAINNGFIYAGGNGGGVISKFYESNLARIENSPTIGSGFPVTNMVIKNGVIYTLQTTGIAKLYENNLVIIGNTSSSIGSSSIVVNNGFIYAVQSPRNSALKLYESNLTLIGESESFGYFIASLQSNNGYIYAMGGNQSAYPPSTIRRLTSSTPFTNNVDNQSWYLIPKE